MHIRSNLFLKSLSLMLVFLLAVPISALADGARTDSSQTSITFKAPSYLVPGKRIMLHAEVNDPAGIKQVRCYFRAVGEADYVFVPMVNQSGAGYVATLPAPASTTTALELLVLVQNTMGFVAKTKASTVAIDSSKEAPVDQQTSSQGTIQVSTELAQAPQTVAGFSDSIVIDVVESAGRFLLVSGAGTTAGMAATSGSAAAGTTTATAATGTAGATSATASSGSSTIMGMKSSTFWWVVAGVAVAVVAGTVAAVSGGSSGGGGGGTPAKSGTLATHW